MNSFRLDVNPLDSIWYGLLMIIKKHKNEKCKYTFNSSMMFLFELIERNRYKISVNYIGLRIYNEQIKDFTESVLEVI